MTIGVETDFQEIKNQHNFLFFDILENDSKKKEEKLTFVLYFLLKVPRDLR
jgi:hypothetical protein